MIVNFGWVEEGRIAGFGVFADLGQSDMDALARQGIGAIVSLTETPLPSMVLGQMNYLHLPIPDMQAPSLADVRRFIQFAKDVLTEGKAIGVHCRAGLGRTGTMLACYLVSRGRTAEDAIAAIRQARPGSIETAEQMRTVVDFASFVAASANGTMQIRV